MIQVFEPGESPTGQVTSDKELRYKVGLGQPHLGFHFDFHQVDLDPITQAAIEAEIKGVWIEAGGERVYEATPAEIFYLHDFYKAANGGIVTDDGQLSIRPYRDHYKDEQILDKDGNPTGLVQNGRSLAYGTGDVSSILIGVEQGTLSTIDQAPDLVVEFDGDPRAKGEPMGDYYYVKRVGQQANGAGPKDLTGILDLDPELRILAMHIENYGDGELDPQHGILIEVDGQKLMKPRVAVNERKNRNAGRTPATGFISIDFCSSGYLSSALDLKGKRKVVMKLDWDVEPDDGQFDVLLECVRRRV